MEDSDAAASSKTGEGGKPRKSRSTSRRRRIREEVSKKAEFNRDAWKLQQQLLLPGASESLMAAALQLLPADGYDAVLEERALDGLCGYPPCSKPTAVWSNLPMSKSRAAGLRNKRWAIDPESREVHEFSQTSQFCDRDCMKLSGEFALRLQPDPAYVRPASAVAASRSAVASAAVPSSAEGEKSEEPSGTEAKQQQERPLPEQERPLPEQERPLPAVRKKAVVRFSRTKQTYSVQYGDYDGGGGLPDVPAASEGSAPQPKPALGVREMVEAPILEREEAPSRSEQLGKDEASEVSTEEGKPEASAQAAEDSSGGEDEDFFERDLAFPTGWSASPFVRAWGVLTNWLSDLAMEVLRGARAELADSGQPEHRGRRELLMELLSSRIPGDLTFLAPRFCDLVAALSVHQSLPSVAEDSLYNLLAALLLSAVYKEDVKRGHVSGSPFSDSVLAKQLEAAAHKLGVSQAEVLELQALLE